MLSASPPPIFGPPVQIAYVVNDPERAAHRWAAELGAGPFFLAEHIAVTDVVHRGRPSTFDHTSAYGWWGATMIELFTQHDDAPSAVRDRFARDVEGLHHVACFVDHLDEALARADHAGLPTAMTARAGDTRFAFVDDLVGRGHFWELYEPSEQLGAFYAMVRSAHQRGDERTVVRLG
jgi:hypothetical protein